MRNPAEPCAHTLSTAIGIPWRALLQSECLDEAIAGPGERKSGTGRLVGLPRA